MSKALPAVGALLLLVAITAAGPPALEIPAEVKPANGYATVRPKTDAKAVTYIALDNVYPFPADLLADKRMFVLPAQGLAAGRYRFAAVGSLNDEHTTVEFAVVVGVPPGPTPPGPQPPVPPGPTPPTPEPPPPIAGDGLKVLIVFEKKEQQKLTAGQLNTIFGQKFRDYMVAKSGQYLILDKDNTAANQPKEWQDAMRRPRASHPWVLISNGKTGFEGPLPAHEEEINLLIRKYGGQ